ncbi:MAG: hypothetical protein ACRDOA_01605 [Streptosporangiaceae bacterium]
MNEITALRPEIYIVSRYNFSGSGNSIYEPFDDGIARRRTRCHGKAMEVAVMSLSARDQQSLDDIADSLADAAPKLAGMLATFTRLTSDEEMPADEEVAVVRPVTRGAPGLFRRSALRRTPSALWILAAIAMLAIAAAISVAASRGARGNGCVTSWPMACDSPAPIHSSRGPTPATAPDRVPPATASDQAPATAPDRVPPATATDQAPATASDHAPPAAVRPFPAAHPPVARPTSGIYIVLRYGSVATGLPFPRRLRGNGK